MRHRLFAVAFLACAPAVLRANDASIDTSWSPTGFEIYGQGGEGTVDQLFDVLARPGGGYYFLYSKGPAAGSRKFWVQSVDEHGTTLADVVLDPASTPPALVDATNIDRAILTPEGGALIPRRESINGRLATVVFRFRPDGMRDTTFGTAGRVELTHASKNLNPYTIHQDSQGRITIGGYTSVSPPAGQGSFVARLTPAGQPQPNFGTQGVSLWQQDPDGSDFVHAVLGHSSGAVYACGAATFVGTRYGMLAKFDSQGVHDLSYGSAGHVIYTADTPQQNRATFCRDVAESPTTARVWMVNEWRFGGPPAGALRAFPVSTTGDAPVNAPDLVFRTGGYPSGSRIAFDAEGRALVITVNRNSALEYDLLLGRVLAGGQVDASFNGTGRIDLTVAIAGLHRDMEEGVKVLVDRGRIVAAANKVGTVTYEDFVVHRLQGTTPFRDGFE